MAGDLQFSWELSGSGWATCRVADRDAERVDVVSYLTDALGDMLRGVAGLYGPAAVQRVSFELEPAEVRWVLRGRGSHVEIAIYEFPDMMASWNAPDEQGTLVWRSTQSRRELGHAVVEAAQAVLSRHGEGGYRAKWVEHPFPVAALNDLRRLHVSGDRCQLRHGT
ncbi:hypothetical protein [Streptomyces sp. NPDC093111]|uniref:hypothetical protein n=1 Tax=Streptomyces sp. NPDC093111 TaxID=3154978 RepID=UPI0034466A88